MASKTADDDVECTSGHQDANVTVAAGRRRSQSLSTSCPNNNVANNSIATTTSGGLGLAGAASKRNVKMVDVLETAANEAQRLIQWPWKQNFVPFSRNEGSKDPKADGELVGRKISLHDISEHHNERPHGKGKKKSHHEKTPKTPNSAKTLKLNGSGNKHVKRPATPPSRRVQFLLGPQNEGFGHEPHPVFCEMEQLVTHDNGEMEWRETARWVKFEEDVEDGGNRWSKPHVATLSLHSLFELRNLLTKGSILLDMEASNLDDIADLMLDQCVNAGILPNDLRDIVKDAVMQKKHHLFEKTNNKKENTLIRSLTEHSIASSKNLFSLATSASFTAFTSKDGSPQNGTPETTPKANHHFMKKLPKNAEASNILVGELKGLKSPLSVFIRLNQAVYFGELTEVPVPSRFLFILLGPPGTEDKISNACKYHEIGRSMATLFSDEVFQELAYKAMQGKHIIAGIDEFLDSVTVIPPGEWDPSIRIEPPVRVASQDGRKNSKPVEVIDEDELREKSRAEAGLVWSGRLFGGLINDLKRKRPHYKSDFVDGLNVQCLASILFMYFAVLAPLVTFGGLLGEATENHISVIEALFGGMLVGVAYGFFSGQPLSILGPTGPILVYEAIIYEMCKSFEWDYLPLRLCIGLWVGVILLVLVATDASACVSYITRFTEENFALLIAVIFIKSAIQKVIDLEREFPLHATDCFCDPINATEKEVYGTSVDFLPINQTFSYNKYRCTFIPENDTFASVINGWQSQGCHMVENVFLASVLLVIGTFSITVGFKNFRSSNFFPTWVRGYLADFAVVIAMVSMTGIDIWLSVETPKLNVPANFSPTLRERSWLVHPLGNNPWWSALFAFLPALLATILIFMDQQITVVIVNRKEHLLKKGCGYHLDLLIVAVMVVICSMFGMPWCEASTVPAINHVKSLTLESTSAAPGEKPRFLGIREQRITHIAVFILIGLSVFMAPMLSLIPMPVLFGLFLFMGVASLSGLQMFDRICLFFMPEKYQPDLTYLRRVPLSRVNLFTLIQLASLAGLWIVKDIKSISVLFPVMLIVMIGIRKFLDCVFTESELRILDDMLPSSKRHEKLDDEDRKSLHSEGGQLRVPLANGNLMTIPIPMTDEVDPNGINITEELTRSGVWKSLAGNDSRKVKNRGHKSSVTSVNEVVPKIDQDDQGIEMTFSKKPYEDA